MVMYFALSSIRLRIFTLLRTKRSTITMKFSPSWQMT